MCIVAVKYFPKTGWVGIKNRDRNYKPTVRIRQSFRSDIERLYIWDEITKYTEGLNEFGVCILNASVTINLDESEGDFGKSNQDYYSNDGKHIRTALLQKNPKNALDKLIELKLPGNTLIFDTTDAYILEATFKNGEFKHKYKKLDKDEIGARTNHGIFFPFAGYKKKGDKHQRKNRTSSEERLQQTIENLKKIDNPNDMLEAISKTPNRSPQKNTLRLDTKRKAMRTTGQLMLIPEERTLYYRPIWCNVDFNFEKLDSAKTKTFFQLLSAREIHLHKVANYLSKNRH